MIVLVVLLVALFICSFSLLWQPALKYTPPGPGVVTTKEFSVIQQVALERLADVEKRSGPFSPYNAHAMDACRNALKSATTLQHIASIFRFLPNHSLGTSPIKPIRSPAEANTFQFEQGTLGWYWGYAVYEEPKVTVMYYVVRSDIGNPQIRAKHHLKLGETTLYSISLGVGGRENWSYNEPVVCGGTYEIKSPSVFSLDCKTATLTFSMKATADNIVVDFSSAGGESSYASQFKAHTRFTKSTPPYLNAPGGCLPCISGIGTLYYSYTQLASESEVFMKSSAPQDEDGSSLTLVGGNGWLDHQWGRSAQPSRLIERAALNFMSVGKLGRYVWINLHLHDAQYMIFAFPRSSKAMTGQTYEAKYNIYANGTSKLLQQGKLTFDRITTFKSIYFPTRLTVHVKNLKGVPEKHTIDAEEYGNAVTIDASGNPHWSGGAALINEKGTAFLELNQFEEEEVSKQTTLALAGLPKSFDASLTSLQLVPSVVALAVLPALVLVIVIVASWRSASGSLAVA